MLDSRGPLMAVVRTPRGSALLLLGRVRTGVEGNHPCKANQDKKVIEAIDVVFKAYRAEKGIKMKE
jgi:hypothetical protein